MSGYGKLALWILLLIFLASPGGFIFLAILIAIYEIYLGGALSIKDRHEMNKESASLNVKKRELKSFLKGNDCKKIDFIEYKIIRQIYWDLNNHLIDPKEVQKVFKFDLSKFNHVWIICDLYKDRRLNIKPNDIKACYFTEQELQFLKKYGYLKKFKYYETHRKECYELALKRHEKYPILKPFIVDYKDGLSNKYSIHEFAYDYDNDIPLCEENERDCYV